MTKEIQKKCAAILVKVTKDLKEVRQLDKGGLNYRKEVWAILKKFRESKTMTIEEVTDQIMAITTPDEKGKKKDNRQKELF